MGYSRNNTLHSNTDELGVIIDGCGNTHEKKYYYNGMWTDLCGMSIEDYIKPTGPDGLTENLIIVEINQGNDFYYVSAKSQNLVLSEVTINVKLKNGEVVKVVIPPGSTESKEVSTKVPFNEPAPKVDNVTYEPKEDDKYKYVITQPSYPDEGYSTINNLVLEKDIVDGRLDEKHILEGKYTYVSETTGGKFKIVIPKLPDDVEQSKENPIKHAIIVCIPNDIYVAKRYKISEGDGMSVDITDRFVALSNTYIDKEDNIEYAVLSLTDSGLKYASKKTDRELFYTIENN